MTAAQRVLAALGGDVESGVYEEDFVDAVVVVEGADFVHDFGGRADAPVAAVKGGAWRGVVCLGELGDDANAKAGAVVGAHIQQV